MLSFDLDTGKAGAEYVYEVGPVPFPPARAGDFATNGVPDGMKVDQAGRVFCTGTTGTSGFGYVQALPAGTWEFTVKLTKGYVEIFNLGTWEGIYFGNAGGSSFVVQYENRNWATGAYTYGGAIGSFTGNGLPVYLKIKSDGTTLSFSYSFSGLNIDYTACGSQAIATNLGSATYIGLGNGANTGIDWFRRTA